MNGISTLVLSLIFCSINISLSFTIENISVPNTNEDSACKNGLCGSTSYMYIHKVFSGLFLSSADIAMLDRLNNAVLATPIVVGGLQTPKPAGSDYQTADDGSICCSTHVQHIANTTMLNIFGVSTSIVHLADEPEPTFQYIPHANCVAAGSCPGECVIEGKVLTLLTVDTDNQLKFDFFEVPGYCSCKRITSQKNDSS